MWRVMLYVRVYQCILQMTSWNGNVILPPLLLSRKRLHDLWCECDTTTRVSSFWGKFVHSLNRTAVFFPSGSLEPSGTRCSSAGEDRSPALSTQNEMPFYYVRGDPGAVILWRNMCARQAHVERDDMNMIGAHANLDHSDHLSLFPGRPSSR